MAWAVYIVDLEAEINTFAGEYTEWADADEASDRLTAEYEDEDVYVEVRSV